MSSDDLESKIVTALKVLSYGRAPVKARTIAQVLSDQFRMPFDKRQINPILYRMRVEGKVARDEYFRWSLKGNDQISSRTVNVQAVLSSPPQTEAAGGAAISSSLVPLTPVRATTPALTGGNSQPRQTTFESKRYGPFEVTTEARRYAAHCRWCSEQIPAKFATVTVRLEGKVMFFCGVDCWQNWESIYWQRAAVKRLHLSGPHFRREQRRITRQKRFLGYRPDLFVRKKHH